MDWRASSVGWERSCTPTTLHLQCARMHACVTNITLHMHNRNHAQQVDLFCECPLWPDDGMCSLRDCSVCECEEHEVPEPWRKAESVDSCDSE